MTTITGLVCHNCNKIYPTELEEAICKKCGGLMTDTAVLVVDESQI